MREQEKLRRIEEKKAAAKAEKLKKKMEAKAAKLAEKEKAKQERLAAKQERKEEREASKEAKRALKEARKQARLESGSGSEEEESEEEEETEEEEEESEEPSGTEEEEESDEDEDEDEDEDDDNWDLSDLDLGSYGSEEEDEEDSGSGGDSDESSERDSDEDREYTGDMFGEKKPIKFAAGKFEVQGQHNPKLGTNDYCCISLWSAGGSLMRYTRLKNSIIRVPPIDGDQMFRVGHDAKRLYYIGVEDGVKKLVIVWLKDLSHRFISLGETGQKIETLEHSSLFRNYLCFQVAEREEKKVKTRLFYRMKKNFFVIDIKT